LLAGFVRKVEILGRNGQAVVCQTKEHLVGGAIGENIDTAQGTKEVCAADIEDILIVDRNDCVKVRICLVDESADDFSVFKPEECM